VEPAWASHELAKTVLTCFCASLFQVLTEREEKASVAIASNEVFSGWTKTFTDPRLCAAIVNRLTFGGNIIETGTDSYRLAHTLRTRDHPDAK
jgi:DNA replication protein DnaC